MLPHPRVLLFFSFFLNAKGEVVIQSVNSSNTHARAPSRVLRDQISQKAVAHHLSNLSEGSTREEAKAREHAVDNIRVQRRSHTSAVENHMWEGTSQASAKANCHAKSAASLLHQRRLDGQDDESAPPFQQFGLCGLFVDPNARQHGATDISRTGVKFPRARQRAP